jgi:hypothetical protein
MDSSLHCYTTKVWNEILLSLKIFCL